MTEVFLCTNGCVEGQLRTKFIERYLSAHAQNIHVVSAIGDADVVLFYACGLTGEKEGHSLSVAGELKEKMRQGAELVVWGCLPKQNPGALTGIYDGPIIGPMDTGLFAPLAGTNGVSLEGIDHSAAAKELATMAAPSIHGCNGTDLLTAAFLLYKRGVDLFGSRRQRHSEVYYIPIAVGCTGHCTYCSERPVFGNTVHSRPIGDIVSEFRSGLERGYSRFSLIATDLGSYGIDIGCRLPDLLEDLIGIGPADNCSILLNQIEPHHFEGIYGDMEPILASGKIEMVMSPVQSGSNRILKLMGRHYTAEQWSALMLDIYRNYPAIRLNTQFMVGFPTETEDDFAATLSLLDPPLRLDEAYIFRFSPRPTVAASRLPDQVPDDVKEARAARLLSRFARNRI
ncbi:radical SAM protein [Methanoculleus sp. 10]|jgi:tRNA A37 methylthiotransferase MiaB|uniref:radical SAM protein n=1 Tax=Methanoculleus sp. 10 TaxID=430615 RepID=UPI001B5ED3D8|nr:radical SAM protein [Methanoculleus sp. 10]MBP7410445.1 radical SAM protein [Methanoculleus sp.]